MDGGGTLPGGFLTGNVPSSQERTTGDLENAKARFSSDRKSTESDERVRGRASTSSTGAALRKGPSHGTSHHIQRETEGRRSGGGVGSCGWPRRPRAPDLFRSKETARPERGGTQRPEAEPRQEERSPREVEGEPKNLVQACPLALDQGGQKAPVRCLIGSSAAAVRSRDQGTTAAASLFGPAPTTTASKLDILCQGLAQGGKDAWTVVQCQQMGLQIRLGYLGASTPSRVLPFIQLKRGIVGLSSQIRSLCRAETKREMMWAVLDLNQRLPACKAGALNR